MCGTDGASHGCPEGVSIGVRRLSPEVKLARVTEYAARVAAETSQVVAALGRERNAADACPYGQADCETLHGGVCVCALPGPTVS